MANKSLLALCCLLAVQSVVMWRMITKNSSGVKPEVEYDPPNSDPLQEAWNAMVRSDSTFVWDPNGPDPMPGVHMVYMYANGSDPAVARAREEFGGSATPNARDRDNGELRYSLRSLEKYAPWFRGDIIILQGDDAPPVWLNTSHPRVKIVRHVEFFANPAVLPTFSSDAIHVNIHRVPGVSDKDIFINWCDDFFVGRPIVPTDWIRDGKPVIYLEHGTVGGGFTEAANLKEKGGNKWLAKIYRTRGFISQVFPEAPPPYSRLNYVKHAPFVFSVPLLKEMAEVFSEEYKSTAISHFRTYDTVDVPTLHNMYCQFKGACILDSQAHMDATSSLVVLEAKDGRNFKDILKAFAGHPPKFFTFNDGWGSSTPPSAEFVFKEMLPKMFPTPSQFELRES